jgi:hypothetical protein
VVIVRAITFLAAVGFIDWLDLKSVEDHDAFFARGRTPKCSVPWKIAQRKATNAAPSRSHANCNTERVVKHRELPCRCFGQGIAENPVLG